MSITGGSAMAAGGKLIYSNMGAATAGNGLNITTTGIYTGTGLSTLTANSMTSGVVEAISATGLTTGTGISVTGGASMAAGGELIDANMGAAVAGNGLNIATTGIYTGTGLLTLTANSMTATGIVEAISATGLTTGTGMSITGGSAMAAGGKLIDLQMGAAAAGNGMNITTSGVYTGTGLLTIAGGSAMTTGTGLSVTASNASLNSTNGLLYVANTGAGTSGIIARIQASSASGSGLTVQADGDVGIGTTNPTAPLTVVGSANIGATTGNLATINTRGLLQAESNYAVANYLVMGQNGVNTAGLALPASATSLLIANEHNDINFRTGVAYAGDWNATGTLAMTISTANVGIGDSTPAALFTVGNGDKFQVSSAGNISFIDDDTASPGHTISVLAEGTAGATGDDLSITAGAGATSGTGGFVNIMGGTGGTTGTGGNLSLYSGYGGSSSGGSGHVNLGTALSKSADSGSIWIQTGFTNTSGVSGDVDIEVGIGATSNGDINIGTKSMGIFSGAPATINIGHSTTTMTYINTPTTIGGNSDINGTLQVDLTGTRTAYAVCHTGSSALANQELLDCTGTLISDYAEQYPVAQGITYGDIVVASSTMVTTLSGDQVPQMVKSTGIYQGRTIGVVSNNYGDFTSAGYNIDAADNPMPIALNGRVLVNVNTENGNIAIGDPITTSSVAGVGMRATKPGMILGYALNEYSGVGTAQINVFMTTEYYIGATITTDGTLTYIEDSTTYKAKGTADGAVQGYNSQAISLRGSGWDGAAAQNRDFSISNSTTDASNYKISFKNNSGVEVASLNQNGRLAVADEIRAGGLDTGAATALDIGITNATSIALGHGGITTTASGTLVANTLQSSGADITGGTIDGVVIGGITRAAGNFTNLDANGTITLPGNSITDAMVSDSITASNYLPLAGGTLTGAIQVGANNTYDLATAGSRMRSGYFATSVLIGSTTISDGSIASSGDIILSPATKLGLGTATPTAFMDIKGNLAASLTGTVDIVNGSAEITGIGTLFTSELKVGDALKIGAEVFTVAAIASDTALTLSGVIVAATNTGLTSYHDFSLFAIKNGAGINKVEVTANGDLKLNGSLSLASGTAGNTFITKVPRLASGTCGAGNNEGWVFQTDDGVQIGHACVEAAGNDQMSWYAESFNSTGTDLAESYNVKEGETVEKGDVVALDIVTGENFSVTRADSVNAKLVLGIVSTRPGVKLSGISEDKTRNDNARPVFVALAGRVPTNVNTQNGPIAKGDLLTLSTTPGVATKWIGQGAIVGRALTALTSGTGKIEVFVKLENIADNSATQIAATQSKNLQIYSDLDLAGYSMNNVRAIRGTTWSIDENGALIAKKVSAEEYIVRVSDEKATIGDGIVTTGASSVIVSNAAVKATAKVFLSWRGSPGSFAVVSEIHDGGFTVALDVPAVREAKFDYWIVDVVDSRTPPVPVVIPQVEATIPAVPAESTTSTTPAESTTSTVPAEVIVTDPIPEVAPVTEPAPVAVVAPVPEPVPATVDPVPEPVIEQAPMVVPEPVVVAPSESIPVTEAAPAPAQDPEAVVPTP
ncbi:MAG: hypothetical protein WCJ29_06060 [bacterium]